LSALVRSGAGSISTSSDIYVDDSNPKFAAACDVPQKALWGVFASPVRQNRPAASANPPQTYTKDHPSAAANYGLIEFRPTYIITGRGIDIRREKVIFVIITIVLMNPLIYISTIAIACIAAIIGVMSAKTQTNKTEPFSADKAEWYYDSAMQVYCEANGKNPESLSEADDYAIWSNASNHCAMILTWVIMNGNRGNIHLKEEPDAVEKIKNREMSGTDFFIKYCDCKLYREDFADAILPFIDAYYDKYLEDYEDVTTKQLNKVLYSFPFSWADYDVYAKALYKAYRRWKFWAKPIKLNNK